MFTVITWLNKHTWKMKNVKQSGLLEPGHGGMGDTEAIISLITSSNRQPTISFRNGQMTKLAIIP
ncbi:hypothetical protein Hanom_Chr03g00203611 [Helianthus anomalus]